MRVSISALLFVASVIALGPGCRFGSDVTDVETPPLFLRSTTPADSAQFTFVADGLDISLVFNRKVSAADVRLRLEPAPRSAGEVVPSTSGRTLTWFDVVIVEEVASYSLLVDGAAMPEPRLVSFHTMEKPQITGRLSGDLRSAHPSGGFGTAVFALRLTDIGPEHAHHARLMEPPFDYPVDAMTLAQGQGASSGPWFQLRGLEEGVAYAIVGILDGNGDGLYEIERDWWGFFHDLADPRPRALVASYDPFAQRTDIDFELIRPGVLEFLDPAGPL